MFTPQGAGWTTERPTLGQPEDIGDAEQDYLAWRANVFAAKEQARPKPIITDEQRRRFLIQEYREGLKSWTEWI